MSGSTTQFITGMKLVELRRQRAKLREAYETLRAAVAEADSPARRLRVLHDGLRSLKFAGRPLHPDVANLEVILFEAESGAASPEILDLWLEKLDAELDAGRARSEAVYLFGALLEEWTRDDASNGPLVEEGRRNRERLLADALAESGPNRHEEVLAPLFEELAPGLANFSEKLRAEIARHQETPVTPYDLGSVLDRLAKDIYRPARLRDEARRFSASDDLKKELADALTILLADLPDWDWPAEGLATRALWTRNKWRLYRGEDLPVACLLEVLGDRWIGIFDRLVVDRESSATTRRSRLKTLIRLGAAEVILENERRMFRDESAKLGLGRTEGADVWGERKQDPSDDEDGPDGGSILGVRARTQARLRSLWGHGEGYDGESGANNPAILLVNAEVQLARAAYPDRPLYVVKVDLEDYYPSLPHDLIRTILRRLGLPEQHLAFFDRFLTPPLLRADGGGPERMKRGVPMGLSLSRLLADLPMRLLEHHVQRAAPVRIVRIVDDLCFLTPSAESAVAAWEAVRSFCDACGLRVNEPKSGALGIGGTLPDALPTARPRWGMIELDELGNWNVHEPTFRAHLEQSRDRVSAAPSVLSKVQLYNANWKYLLNAVVLAGPLGDHHRGSANRAVIEFHRAFFGPDRGIVEGVRGAIRERFLDDPDAAPPIPEAWIYWPITAGGLALRDPLVVAAQYDKASQDRKPVLVPAERTAGWDRDASDWGDYYSQYLEPLEPVEPEETKVMKALVDDFIARGAEISSGKQTNLNPYWRWVLGTYGPQILRRFGTFRFLITELVPLQLIGRQLVRDSSLGDGGGATDENEIPF